MSESQALQVQPIDAATGIIAVIERAAMNPDVDIEKMERLMAMQERIMDRNAEAEFAAAMTRVQSKLPTVFRESANQQTNSRYAKHEHMAKTIKPIYTKEGFSITFSEGETTKENHIRVNGILRHSSGHKEPHHVDIPLDIAGIKGNANKTETHATGSTFSYGRRYLTLLIFDVATGDDDDGNSAMAALNDAKEKFADSIIVIKDNLVEGGDLSIASEAWYELSDEVKAALWVAPSKGGPFTTKERDIMKSKAFRESHYGQTEDKTDGR